MQCQRPEYTDEARLAHLAGVVTMSLVVNDDGTPADIHVVTPLGLGLDESAVACMSQSRYSPAQKDGKPVPFKLTVSLGFDEHWDSDWHLGAAAFHTAGDVTRPRLAKAGFPEPSGDRRSVTVCLRLTVDKDGTPRAVQAASPQDARLDRQAIALVAAWRFHPGTQNGHPVDVPATLMLVHGAGSRVTAIRRAPQ
jgi:TonB family protein